MHTRAEHGMANVMKTVEFLFSSFYFYDRACKLLCMSSCAIRYLFVGGMHDIVYVSHLRWLFSPCTRVLLRTPPYWDRMLHTQTNLISFNNEVGEVFHILGKTTFECKKNFKQ